MTFESSRFAKVFTFVLVIRSDGIRMNMIRIGCCVKRDDSPFLKVIISEVMWRKTRSNILLLVIVENYGTVQKCSAGYNVRCRDVG